MDDVWCGLLSDFSTLANQTRSTENPGRFDCRYAGFRQSSGFEGGVGSVTMGEFADLLGNVVV